MSCNKIKPDQIQTGHGGGLDADTLDGSHLTDIYGYADALLAGHLAALDPHPQYITTGEGASLYEALGAVAAHTGQSDPHPQYLTETEADGLYEPLGSVTTPTGTGFRHVTAGVEDPAAKLVENADVHASAAIASSKLADGAYIPSSGEKDALVGTSGTPGSGNKYVTNDDLRNTNSRAPTGSAGGDLTGGYPNPTVATSAITNAKMADMAQSTVKGRAVSAGTGAPTDLSSAQLTAIVDTVVGDSGSGGTKGLVPAAGSGDGAARYVLLANGAFGLNRGIPKAYIGYLGNVSGTYTPSTGTTCFLVRVTGAGAGGGGAASTGSAGGGGAGGYAEKWYFGPSLSTYAYQGRAGGAGGLSGPNNGSAPAGATTFDTVTVPASNGGTGAASGTAISTNAGGAPSAIPTGGDLNIYGGPGFQGIRLSASGLFAGNGAPSHFGAGGRGGGVGGAAGENAVVYGAGGGGATASAGVNQAGGNGGDSLIEIWEFY
jgi:hypothetical protein